MKLSELLLSYNQIDTPQRFVETEVVLPQSKYQNMLTFVESKKEEEVKKEEPKQNVTTKVSTLDDITWAEPSPSQKSARWSSPYSDKNKWTADMIAAYKRQGLNDNAIKNLIAKNALESAWGKSAQGDYNFGNITAGKSWKGRIVEGGDKNAAGKAITQRFRAYDSLDDYVKDEIQFLTNLYDFNQDDDISKFLDKLQGGNSAGRKYAEDPSYRNKVKSIYLKS